MPMKNVFELATLTLTRFRKQRINSLVAIKFLPLTLTFKLGPYILVHQYQDSKIDTPTISKLLHVTDTGCKII